MANMEGEGDEPYPAIANEESDAEGEPDERLPDDGQGDEKEGDDNS
jgi:hypothetical protein